MNNNKKEKYESIIKLLLKLVNEKYYSGINPGKKLKVNLEDVIEDAFHG